MELEPLGDRFGLCGDGKAAPARQGDVFAAIDGGLRLDVLRLIGLHGQRGCFGRAGAAGGRDSGLAAPCRAGHRDVAAQQHHQCHQHPDDNSACVFVLHGLHAPFPSEQ